MNQLQTWIGRVKRKRYCKHAMGTRHCGNPKCKFYIGRWKQ